MKARLDRWYRNRLGGIHRGAPPVYSSVDLRNSGFKISVIDTNLFPTGFNNLCETFSDNGSEAFRSYFKTWHPSVKKILIYPEEHTRNLHYWKNISALQQMLQKADFEVQVGSASTLFSYPFFAAPEGWPPVTVQRIFLRDGELRSDDFIPDAILINNDLSPGVPDYLKDVKQVLIPSPRLGWHSRKKGIHFLYYQELIHEVSDILGIDPWLLSPLMTVESGVDLTDEICLKRLRDSADRLISRIRQKYMEYGIRRDPYLFIKNNSGTYGLGMTHIDSGSQLLTLNRRTRNKLESAKGGQHVSEYLLQEGIPTADLYHGKPLEPVVYLVGGEAIGTFFRIHEEKSDKESLNAPGMDFTCLCLHKVSAPQKKYQLTYNHKDQLYLVASLLGKIASLASVLEWQNAQQNFAQSA